MSAVDVLPAIVAQRSFGRPTTQPESVARVVVIAEGDGATYRRRVEAFGDDAYRLRSGLLRVTGQCQWGQVLHAPVQAMLLDGVLVAVRSPEGAADDVQLSFSSLTLCTYEVTS